MFAIFSASAEVGVNVGISGSAGGFYASATEVDSGGSGDTDETRDANDVLAAGWSSVFLEKTLGDRITIGVDVVTSKISTRTGTRGKTDRTTTSTDTAITQDVQVDFTNLATLYASFSISESAYIRAGLMTVDVETNESLGTGSTYGNTNLQGTVVGFGWNKSMDSGIFLRAEANYLNFDGKSLTSSSGTQKITLDTLEGVQGKLSIGKSF